MENGRAMHGRKVYTRSDEDLTNNLLPVKLADIWGDGVWGEAKKS